MQIYIYIISLYIYVCIHTQLYIYMACMIAWWPVVRQLHSCRELGKLSLQLSSAGAGAMPRSVIQAHGVAVLRVSQLVDMLWADAQPASIETTKREASTDAFAGSSFYGPGIEYLELWQDEAWPKRSEEWNQALHPDRPAYFPELEPPSNYWCHDSRMGVPSGLTWLTHPIVLSSGFLDEINLLLADSGSCCPATPLCLGQVTVAMDPIVCCAWYGFSSTRARRHTCTSFGGYCMICWLTPLSISMYF